MKNSDEPSSAMPRISCRPSRLVGSANSGEPGIIAGVMIIANTRNRIQAISIDGSVADRYFAVTSETPRKIVEARISAMPLNGRSARAGALRSGGLLLGQRHWSAVQPCGCGGGRCHGNLEGSNDRIGRGSKKRQLSRIQQGPKTGCGYARLRAAMARTHALRRTGQI